MRFYYDHVIMAVFSPCISQATYNMQFLKPASTVAIMIGIMYNVANNIVELLIHRHFATTTIRIALVVTVKIVNCLLSSDGRTKQRKLFILFVSHYNIVVKRCLLRLYYIAYLFCFNT